MHTPVKHTISLVTFIIVAFSVIFSFATPNPVFNGAVESDVFKYNGEYYFMAHGFGGDTFSLGGGMKSSTNLVNWPDQAHVFSMTDNLWAPPNDGDGNIHVPDLIYDYDGTIHLYWSGVRALIGHAESISEEPMDWYNDDNDAPFDGHEEGATIFDWDRRIDPHCFKDDDGKYYFYTTKLNAPEGNVIWGQPMDNPRALSSTAPYPQISVDSLDTPEWERRTYWNGLGINEGEHVFKYRDKYYMLYNANFVGSRPMLEGRDTNGKVVSIYIAEDDDAYIGVTIVLVHDSSVTPGNETTIFENNTLTINIADGQSTAGNIADAIKEQPWIKDATTSKPNSAWVLCNGTPEECQGRDFIVLPDDYCNGYYAIGCAEADSPLGFENEYKYPEPVLDLTRWPGTAMDHCIENIGHPSIVRGPNGFEWWVVYFAFWDGWGNLGTGIDRVYFFDRTLFVDGPTSKFSTGYHPGPAEATFSDLFNGNDSLSLPSHWNDSIGSDWQIQDKEAVQLNSVGSHEAMAQSTEASNYLIEANIKFISPIGDKAGLIAYREDSDNWLKIGFVSDAGTPKWYHTIMKTGDSSPDTTETMLPPGFNLDVYHKIQVTKNHTDFQVMIDDMPAPGPSYISSTGFTGKSLPGLYTENAQATFDGFIYTAGWDEYDDKITGWDDSIMGAPQTGTWSIGSDGISSTELIMSKTFKGDFLSQYEYSTQVSCSDCSPGGTPVMGIYGIYIDDDHYVAADIEVETDRLKISNKQGASMTVQYVDVPDKESYHLRIVKLFDSAIVFVDGQEVLTIDGIWGKAQVGLRTDGMTAQYNGITLFKLGSQYGCNCMPPVSGDWEINQICTIEGSVMFTGNVFVTNNALLTIDYASELGIDFKNKHLKIDIGSGVFVKGIGKIYQNP